MDDLYSIFGLDNNSYPSNYETTNKRGGDMRRLIFCLLLIISIPIYAEEKKTEITEKKEPKVYTEQDLEEYKKTPPKPTLTNPKDKRQVFVGADMIAMPTFLAADLLSLERMNKLALANDLTGVQNLTLEGRLFFIEEDTPVKVIQVIGKIAEVRIMGGGEKVLNPKIGSSGWIYTDFLK